MTIYKSAHSGEQVDLAVSKSFLSGASDPTTSTVGIPGQRYFNAATKKEFVCTAIEGTEFIWKKADIGDDVVIYSSIIMGMNSVIRRSDGMTSIPKFTLQGKSYVNLLGKDGNCEDINKFNTYQATISLDNTNKVFGANSVKATATGTSSSFGKFTNTEIFALMSPSKYYMFSAYVKNGNMGNATAVVQLYTNGTGRAAGTAQFTINTATFTRALVKMQPADWGTGSTNITMAVNCGGASGQYFYADGMQLVEISAADYALTEAQLMEKYPYVDSYACLQNPYIEVRHDNLVRNGNGEEGVGWWTPYNANVTVSVENGKLKIASASGATSAYQTVKVKPNTNYYISGNVTTGSVTGNLIIRDSTLTTIRIGAGTFNTGSLTEIQVHIAPSATGTSYFDSIMLIEGTTAPTSYKPCRIERCVIEGKFTSDDTVTLENGEVSGLLNWKHRTLYGKDYDWQYHVDLTGCKRVGTLITPPNGIADQYITICIDSKGYPLKQSDSTNAVNEFNLQKPTGLLLVNPADADTGWAESIAPNADEVKAFMNGWKATSNNGTRYISWVSVVDGSSPSSAVKTLAVGTNATGQKVINVTTGEGNTKFAIGDNVYITGYGWETLSAVSANSITLTNNLYTPVTNNTQIIKADNGTTNLSLLTYCKNNIAPGYEGYQLHYKLANPEPITDANVHVRGDIPKLDNGDNYLYVDSGMVLGEVANPVNGGDGYYRINDDYTGTGSATFLNYRNEVISTIYKNQVFDNRKWIFTDSSLGKLYGVYGLYAAVANVDTNATYTADYQILKTMHTTPTSITMQYQQDVLSAVADLADGLNSRQKADSALDTLVDLSVYEEINTELFTDYLKWVSSSGVLYVLFQLNFMARKNNKPNINIKNVNIRKYTASVSVDVTSLFSINAIQISKNVAWISFRTTDAATITDIKTYGATGFIAIVADCGGK